MKIHAYFKVSKVFNNRAAEPSIYLMWVVYHATKYCFPVDYINYCRHMKPAMNFGGPKTEFELVINTETELNQITFNMVYV